MLADYKIRIIGRACITRYDNGEGTLNEIITNNYNSLSEDDKAAVKDFVYSSRPDIV